MKLKSDEHFIYESRKMLPKISSRAAVLNVYAGLH